MLPKAYAPAGFYAPTYTGGGQTLASSGDPSIDCATSSFVTNVLAAGGLSPNAAQLAIIPSLITSFSREINLFCGRKFAKQQYTEIVVPEMMRLDVGRPAAAKLTQRPLLSVDRCATGRVPALTIENTDTTTNQDASVALVASGDMEWEDLTYTGLTLTRYASGTEDVQTISWTTTSPYTTIQGLADSINALGNGWSATVQSSALSNVSIAMMPAAWLVGAREPKSAFDGGATLGVFSAVGRRYDVNRTSGILTFHGWLPGEWGGWFWFGGQISPPYGSPDDEGCWGTGWGEVRVWYTAGFATVPEDIQRVCAESVKLALERLKGDSIIKSKSGGNEGEHWSWTVRDTWSSLPQWCMDTLWRRKGDLF